MFHLLKRNLRRFIFKPRKDLYVFIFGGREFQTDDPENAKLVLYRSIRVRGNKHLFDPYRAGALFRRSHTYLGARPIRILNVSTAVLYINCSCNGRISSAFNFADVDRERSGKISFAACLWREFRVFFFLYKPHWHYSAR